jgi:GNAT acetyltransferase
MTITNLSSDVLTTLPDLPRWLEARGLLLSRRGFAVDTADGCRLICGRKDRVVVPVTVELSPLLEVTALREVPHATILVQDVMLPAARYHLPDWTAEPATLYTLPADRARAWPLPEWPTSPISADQVSALTHLPYAMRDTLLDAVTHGPVWAASMDGQPMSFAHTALATELWFDVEVYTLDAARNRGLGRAAAMGLIVDRMLQGLRPVWGATRSNEASNELARRLGFEPVDLVWLLTQ